MMTDEMSLRQWDFLVLGAHLILEPLPGTLVMWDCRNGLGHMEVLHI